jgi:hypothetical protein
MAPSGTLTAKPARSINVARAANLRAPARPQGVEINRPTMSMKAYRGAKAAAAAHRSMGKPMAPVSPAKPRAPFAPSVAGFAGIQQSGSDGWFPPDVNGAVSKGYNVLTTNDRYVVWNKNIAPTVQANKTLNTLVGYSTESMFDPRVIYDGQWNRFVVSSDAFAESSTTQILALAITKGGNPTAGVWSYLLNGQAICGSGVFVDYPQISMTQDAIITTVNCFNGNTYLGSGVIAVPKSILYNGLGFSVPVFRYFATTATPPNVIDGNPTAHILLGGGGAAVQDLAFNNPQGGFYATMSAPVSYTGWFTPTVPPNAHQSGCATTSCQIDTSDGRFVSPSTQVGTALWNTATYGSGSFPVPFWGQFNTTSHNLTQSGSRFLSASSDDWNSSLVADPSGNMWMTFSSAGTSAFASEVVAGRKSTDPAGTAPSILVAKTSAATLTGDFDANFGVQRWGDTSQVTRDPTTATQAWAWNEWVPNSSNWGTFSARFNNP